ncbi:MAG: bifunctional diaminohydroxyphosphoribosylaminopyrimidine deaminase/5-amino-6-(5-phosphoribosylamino)uracil reductase RibD [Thermoleophilia bacterium]|nr:bifunctional diaminohydroxyphosphoribosylaminopyrimidine deaminase/5-amino-6-(5-phosphoribosylamino)uracil reductase RibD [Thermoleophilia bacterium]
MLPDSDIAHLHRTLELAEQGRYGARPNPLVGAVLASPTAGVIAEGYHAVRGEAHAERAALDLLSLSDEIPADATLYVSLEPCAHHGRQPPCTDLVLGRGIRRVVIATADPNPETCGDGPRRLAAAGVEVAWAPHMLAAAATLQNVGFHSVHRRGRPFITGKWAITEDWRVATGDPDRRWISSDESLEMVQYLRAASGAILVGVGTVLADDPRLNVRGLAAERMLAPHPLRVIVDSSLRTSPDSRLVRSAHESPVLIACSRAAFEIRSSGLHCHPLEAAGCEIVPLSAPRDEQLLELMEALAARGVNDVLVESGPTLAASLIEGDLLDRVVLVKAPISGVTGTEPGFAEDHPLRFVEARFRDRATHERLDGDDIVEFDVHMIEPLDPG